jgi:hypothetical protein
MKILPSKEAQNNALVNNMAPFGMFFAPDISHEDPVFKRGPKTLLL